MKYCIALALFSVLTCFAAYPLDIVRDGAPVASIVIAENAGDQLKDAADLLLSCIEESTGAKLPIAHEAPATGPVVFIGSSPFKVDLEGLDEDGYAIAFPDDRSVAILGPTDWGTEFGVYEFLERYVGVLWLMPGPDGTDIPKQTSISVPAEPVRDAPAFFSRLFSGLRGPVQTNWARRNRMHGRVSFHHNLLRLFPPETYTKTHPEFFPIQHGKRFLPPTNDTHHWQPCFTAPGIVEEAVANITRYFDENPEATSYSLGTNDSSGYCECDQCKARISGGKNFLGRVDYSDLFYDWANHVIEGVLEKHPDKWFGCLAYSEVAAPPKNVNVHARLIPYMTYDRMKWIDPEIRKTGEELTKAWHEKSPVVGWYDYIYGSPYCLPRVWFHHMADYYRSGHANGVRALYAEAYPNWGEGPKLYVSLKLQWDPTRDVDELLDEWITRCVGEEAAPHLASYYAHWEDFWTRRILDSRWFSAGGQYLSFYNPRYLDDVEIEEIENSREWLETALAKAKTDKQKGRASLLLQAFEYYEATAYAYKSGAEIPEGPIEEEQQALAILDHVEKGIAFAEKRRRLALEVFPDHPVLVHPIPITNNGFLQGDSWSSGSLWQVYDLAAKADGPVRGRIRDMAKQGLSQAERGRVQGTRGGDGTVPVLPRSLQSQAQMMLALIKDAIEPLTANHSFEQGEGPAADGWSWWVKWGVGGMRRTDEVAHSGEYSVLCDGIKRGGPVQELLITPGKYGLVCFVYVPEGQTSKGAVELSMTLRNAAGDNLPSSATQITPAPGRWTALGVAADVPEKIGDQEVKKVLPILIVDGFAPDEKVYFDDLALYRLQQ